MNPYANAGNSAAAYKNQQVQNSSPGQLTLMLYSGAARFITENSKAIEDGRMDAAHNAHVKTQNIMLYLIETLDMQYDISHNLFQLYEYINFRMNEANLKKDVEQLEEAKGLVIELRDTWCEAMKQDQAAQGNQISAQKAGDHANAVKLSLYSGQSTASGGTPDGVKLNLTGPTPIGK